MEAAEEKEDSKKNNVKQTKRKTDKRKDKSMASGKAFMYETIYNDLLEGIRNGTYPAGSRLPSEKELAGQYGVSRITSKKALELLAERGMISRMPGRGSFVLETAVKQTARYSTPQIPETNGQAQEIRQTGRTIGVILDSFDSDYVANYLRSMERECSRRGINMLLKCTYGSIEAENQAIKSCIEIGAQGLIIMCAQNETYNTTIVKLALDKFPVVLIDRKMQGLSIPCIATDNHRASRELTEMLIERGHKQLVFVTHASMGTSSIKDRYEGFVEGIMEDAGINGCVLEIPDYNPTPGNSPVGEASYDEEGFKKLLLEHREYTGYLCIEAKLCYLLRKAMKETGVTGEIVSFDGTGDMEHEKVIAYVRQDERAMGVMAVDILEKIVHGESISEDICVPYRVIKLNDI